MEIVKQVKAGSASGANGTGVERVVSFNDTAVLQHLVGEQDVNINTIERKLDVKIGRQEDGLLITGQEDGVQLATDLITQLRDLIKSGESIYDGDLERAIRILSEDRKSKLVDLLREQIHIAGRKKSIVPKTPRQREYIEAIRNRDLVFGIGPAGTGKTYLAMAMAVSALVQKKVNRVVLCRPAVEAGEKLGFLPGDMAEKVNPYLRPLYDALHDMVDFDRAKELVEKGAVEVAPLAFMRGRTLSNAFVILDEAQNTTSMQMKMLLTRLGHGSKAVITGDITQIDLPRGVESGLSEALTILGRIKEIAVITFDRRDVIRHPLVAKIVDAYERSGEEEG